MILFYSGPNQPSQPSNAFKSLGGYISNTNIVNGMVSNLFPEVTRGDIRDQKKEVRLIALQNESVGTITNVKVYTNTPVDSLFEYKIGVIAPALDTVCNKYYFELLQSPNQLPISPSLDLHEGLGNAINIASMLAGSYVGLWISREYKPGTLAIFSNSDDECSDNSLENLAEIELLTNTQSNIDIVISY